MTDVADNRVREKSVLTSPELWTSVAASMIVTVVAAVALRKFREHQAFLAKPLFLRQQQPFLRQAIEALPQVEQQFLQAAHYASLKARVNELQLAAIELAGPESRLWNADQWLTWIKGDQELKAQINELCEAGRYCLDPDRIARRWAENGPVEDLVQKVAELQKTAPKESANWTLKQWQDWKEDPQLGYFLFVRCHRQVYSNFLSTARRSVGPQWETLSAEQWLAHLQQAPGNYYHPMHASLYPLINQNSPFCALYPDSPIACHVDPEHFFECLAIDLASKRELPLGFLDHQIALENGRASMYIQQLSDEGRRLLEQL